MAKITADTEFPRSWEEILKDGDKIKYTTQPYISGLYTAIEINGKTAQTSVAYKKIPSLLKKLQSSSTVKNLVVNKLGDYLAADDLAFLN